MTLNTAQERMAHEAREALACYGRGDVDARGGTVSRVAPALLALLLAACGGGGGDDEPAVVPMVPVVHTANINPQLPPGH